MARPITEILAANLNRLKRDHPKDLGSQPRIATKAKVGQRTVGRALKAEASTTIGSIEKIADAFGLEAWQLLHPNLDRALDKVGARELTAQQPLAIYDIDQQTVATLLDQFDKLTKPQRREFLAQLNAAVIANVEAARHLGGRLSVLPEDAAAQHLPPAPKK